MTPTTVSDKLVSWASVVDDNTIDQALRTSRLPIVEGHVALMPDAHLGIGATVGSVIPTRDAVIPAAVGVDLGCGMIASRTRLAADQLPDDLDPLLPLVAKAVPAGLGKWHSEASRAATDWLERHPSPSELSADQTTRAAVQFGTLGSGNHFFEVCLDADNVVWLVLHSGSRGIGHQLATAHIKKARALASYLERQLEDPDLAYFLNGTPEFNAYIADMLWAQNYALANREQMMREALRAFFAFVGTGQEVERINCHHNFTARENHDGRWLWITRKGAIKADRGDRGIIPGSMGTRSYIVRGRGNAASYASCAHGAGRRLSRTAARKAFSGEDLAEAMKGKTWLRDNAAELVDEAPGAYKDVDQVMRDQHDLVEVENVLSQVFNYKGVGERKRRRS